MLILCYFHIVIQFILSIPSGQSNINPVVSTNNGLISGKTLIIDAKNIHYFLGIPYTEPPIGHLRFKKPVPKNKWTGIYEAFFIQPACIQIGRYNDPTSEDCLYLNIWTPTLNTSANLSVLFWIHGGGLVFGSSTDMDKEMLIYDGKRLARNGIVVVTINYRLGVFGFLYGNSEEAPGNQGFWDQNMAMKWTKENIAAFGGNPNDVTIIGQSAGSWSVSAHILSPFSRNLYQKAIMQSGSLYLKRFLTDKESGYRYSSEFASRFLCIDDWIGCLRNISAEELNLAQTGQYYLTIVEVVIFKPIFDDEFLPQSAVQSLKDGNFKHDVNLLIGHNELEVLWCLNNIFTDFPLNMRYKPKAPLAINFDKNAAKSDIKFFTKINNDTIAELYTAGFDTSDIFQLAINQNNLRRAVLYAFGDYVLVCPTVLFGANLVKNRNFTGKVFQYRLTYANSRSMSRGSIWAYVTHRDDLPLTFGRPFDEKGWSDADRRMSKIYIDVVTTFAKKGYPPKVNNKIWPEYSLLPDGSVNASYLEFNPDIYKSGKVFNNRYKGNDGMNSPIINNCINFWDEILSGQY